MTTNTTLSVNAAGLLAFAAGVLTCLAVAWLGQVETPWGTRWYYLIGLPVMSAAVGAISYLHPRQPGRWTVYLCLGQLLVAWVLSGLGEVLVGVLFLMALSLPIFISAIWLSRVALRRQHAAAEHALSSSDDSQS